MMRFQPKTEEQIAAENLLEIGFYDFEVLEAHDKVSKAAQQRGATEPNMIHLKVKVFEDGERGPIVDDYLMPEMAFKLRHFCVETGLLDEYNAGELSAGMCVGKIGRCKVGPGKPNGNYPPKNEIKDYGDKAKAAKRQPQSATVSKPLPHAKSSDPDWGV